jgi:hypothetical protein
MWHEQRRKKPDIGAEHHPSSRRSTQFCIRWDHHALISGTLRSRSVFDLLQTHFIIG